MSYSKHWVIICFICLQITDELLIFFSSVCSEILDVVAPYKVRKPKLNPAPWLNNMFSEAANGERINYRFHFNSWGGVFQTTRLLWELQGRIIYWVLLSHIMSLYVTYNGPAALFSTINRFLNQTVCFTLTPSLQVYEMFRIFFVEKVEMIWTSLPTSSVESVMSPVCIRSFDLFEQVSLAQVMDLIMHLNPTPGGCDVVHLRLKEMVDVVGLSITSIVNNILLMELFQLALSRRLF